MNSWKKSLSTGVMMMTELKAMLENMEYPDSKPYAGIEKKEKISFILERAKQYNNADKVLDFIKKSGKTTVSDIFEAVYDSDLFKD